MSTTEAESAQENKMVVDEPAKEEKKEEEKKDEEQKNEGSQETRGVEEEKKESPGPRRSSRITATAGATASASNGTPSKGKRGSGAKATKKRSADDLAADVDGADGKTKKAKKADEEEEGLKVGESPPDLVLKNEQGEEIKVQTLAENKKGVVLFLVPKADTPGCTAQACGFRDINSEFTQQDFAVYCLSADAPDKQKKWKDKKSLPFPLLSDPDRTLIEKLTGSAKKTARSHFVFAGGKLVDKRIPVKPADSPRLALEFIKAFEVGKSDNPDAIKELDTADVAAATAAASAAVEPTEPSAVTTGNITEQTAVAEDAAPAS